MLFFIACSDDTFCISDYSDQGVGAQIGEQAFTLPNGTVHMGEGVLPIEMTFGDYTGEMRSIITSQTPTATGFEATLVHYWSDTKGNSFWTSDNAVFDATDQTQTTFVGTDTMTIVDGRGDFDCASGQLINQATLRFATQTLDYNVTGEVCGGCE